MRPRSCDPRHGARDVARAVARALVLPAALVPLALVFGLLFALLVAATSVPAFATTTSTVVVRQSATPGDTITVKEITIDDEGIRISGSGKDITVPIPPAPPDVDVKIGVDGTSRVIQIGDDSTSRIVVHSPGENEIVQFFRDVHVERGERAGDVVALFGNIRNDGIVSGDCVAIMGSVTQGDSAAILGDAVAIGGAVRESGVGARVEGQTVSMGFLPWAGLEVPTGPFLILFGLLAFLLFVGLAGLAGRLFPQRLMRMAETISRRTFLSLLLGLLSVPLAFMLGLLLMVTVIGIPLAALLPFLFLLAAFLGYTAAAYLLGLKLLGRRLDAASGVLVPVAVGTAFVTIFYVVGVPLIAIEGWLRVVGFGFLMLWVVIGTVCWMLGLGALLLSRIGQEPQAPEPSPWSTSGGAPVGPAAGPVGPTATAAAGPNPGSAPLA